MPRWPPESAGFSTAGTPVVSSAACRSLSRAQRGERRLRHAALREAGAASPPCASSGARSRVPIPGRPSASATAATTGTARSADTVSTPSTSCRRADVGDGLDVGEVDDLASSAAARPGASALRSTATTRRPELARALDRTALVPARADEEDGSLHSAAMLSALNG